MCEGVRVRKEKLEVPWFASLGRAFALGSCPAQDAAHIHLAAFLQVADGKKKSRGLIARQLHLPLFGVCDK